MAQDTQESESRSDFDIKKTYYFGHLGQEVRSALALHKGAGNLWERDENRDRSWGNVSEHCLVEVARARVFAELLELPEDVTNDLVMAAALHDYFKRREQEIARGAEGTATDRFAEANRQSEQNILDAGFSARVVTLAGCLAEELLPEAEKIARKPELSADDLAYLSMHYIDDYTVDAEWSSPMIDGRNALDQRVDLLESNPRYNDLNEEYAKTHDGETAFQAQRRVSHLMESRIAEYIGKNSGSDIDPLALPTLVDDRIRQGIEAVVIPVRQ